MSGASAGFLEFAVKAWNNRHHIMQGKDAEDRTYRIYNFYNYFEGLNTPDLCELLTQVELQFNNFAGHSFYFQNYFEVKLKGDDIASMAKSVNEVLDNDASIVVLLKDLFKKSYSRSYFDETTHTFRAPQTKRELIEADPAFLLDQFLWNFTPRRNDSAKYRIYVTPKAQYAPKVFLFLVHHMHQFLNTPSSGKLALPGPSSDKRVDKIVLYCQSKLEMEGGINLLKDYQKSGRAYRFENLNPLSTKPLKGLAGVAVTVQPTPDEVIMHYAGIEKNRVKGISFGMSRAAIIYLAMRDNYRKPGDASIDFLRDCHKIARLAGINIEQNQDALDI